MSPKARPWIAGLVSGLSVGLLGLVLAVLRPSALERSELWSYDLRIRSAAADRQARTDIVLIKVSEQDITNVEDNLSISWPWPRALFGYIATYAKRAGARVITYDWLFQERGQFSVGDAEELATALHEAGNTVIGLALTSSSILQERKPGAWAAELGTFPTKDEAVAAALKLQAFNTRTFLIGKGPFTVWYGGLTSAADLTAMWTRLLRPENAGDVLAPDAEPEPEPEPAPCAAGSAAGSAAPDKPPAPVKPPPTMRQLTEAELATEVNVAALVAEREGTLGTGPVPKREGIDPPLGVLAFAPARLGHVHQTNDIDSVMREHAPLAEHDGRLFPSLPLASYLVAHPTEKFSLEGHTLHVGDKTFELDASGRFVIRFVTAGSYRQISAYDILRSQALLDEGKPPIIKDEELKGAYVIVAATAHGLRDLRPTPMSEAQLGAEINANVLDNLEEGKFIHRASPAVDGIITLLLCLLAAVTMTALSRAFKRVIVAFPLVLLATVVISGGYVMIAGWALSSRDLWLAVATPAISSALASFVTVIVLSAVERQNRRFVQEALGRYTSPALVRELIEHPEHLSLEWGEEREMSVYFSDLAGFTTISEHLSAKDLVTLLNEYLTEMTDLVLAHGGIVDKYIGDAVMAFWGAPLRDKQHALHAVSCAIAMRKRCDELRAGWQARFGHALHARAGVNSGGSIVGNMGSKHKYNYTVMGDMVNLAARLEGANKPYGTYLMISETTLAELGGAVEVRELDLVAVKGKDKAVRVFEVLDLKGQADPALVATARKFEEALALYRARKFTEAKAMFSELGDDPPSKLYVERCTYFETEPPADGWDGVWHMKEK
ncbi:MAG: adenylate/guanylate cyclase domain-containing protein [Myxococcales bacterium]|nr:adenylate/guanylate cyclase domain-containing protein [Myxococcales bacterium]